MIRVIENCDSYHDWQLIITEKYVPYSQSADGAWQTLITKKEE